MKYLSTLLKDVNRQIQDVDDLLTEADIESAIGRALRILSFRSPYLVFETITGDGTTDEWALATATWISGFSKVGTVYYPWDTTDTPTPPPPLDPSCYATYEKTAGAYWFRLNALTPSASEYVRVYYNSRHAVTNTASTLRDEGDEDSVILLAASFCLDMMAVRVIALSNSNIASDTVSYQTRQSQYEAMSKIYREQSGLSGYLKDAPPLGGAAFVSIGRRARATDNF